MDAERLCRGDREAVTARGIAAPHGVADHVEVDPGGGRSRKRRAREVGPRLADEDHLVGPVDVVGDAAHPVVAAGVGDGDPGARRVERRTVRASPPPSPP